MAGIPGAGGGGPVHTSWLGPLGCRAGPAYCNDEHQDMGNREWSYVGQGRGGYKVVVWVGEGNSSVNVESQQPQHPPSSSRKECNRWKTKCCMIFYQGILCMTVVCLVLGTVFAVPSIAVMFMSAWTSISGIAPWSAAMETKDPTSDHEMLPSQGSTLSLNCSRVRGLSIAWSVEERRWCCNNERIGCHLFDCKVYDATRELNWSAVERDWCCTHYKSVCSFSSKVQKLDNSVFQTNASQGDATIDSYDCRVGILDWETDWSPDKQEFCCQYGGVGCSLKSSAMTSTSILTATFFGSTPGSLETILHTTLHEAVVLERSPAQVSAQVSTPAAQQVEPTISTKVSPSGVPAKPTPAAPSAPASFDCNMGYDHWEMIWTVAKKFWCCEYGGRCPIRKK